MEGEEKYLNRPSRVGSWKDGLTATRRDHAEPVGSINCGEGRAKFTLGAYGWR